MSVETISISPTENSIGSIGKIVQDCESVHNNTTETFNDDDDNDDDNGTDKIEEEKEGVEGKQLMLPYYFPFSALLSSTNPLWMSRSNCVFSDSLLTLTCTLAASSVKAYVLPFLLSRCRDYMIKRKESSGTDSNDQYYDYLSLFSTYKYSGSLYKFSSSTGTDYFNKNHSESCDNNSHSSSSCCSVEKDSIKSHSMSDSYELDSIGLVVDDYGDDNTSYRISHYNLSEKHLLAISNDFYEDECCEQVREARLDYIITQMDIARMARNASRHLDVESILALPTITYHKNRDLLSPITTSTSNTNMNSKTDNNIGWSWQLIQDNVEDEQLEVNVDMDDTTTNATAQTQQVSCVICLENFKDGDQLRVLPCDHMFHIGCIDHWLLGTFSDDECFTFGCPTCKKKPASTHTNNLDLCLPVVNEETIISNENTEEENDNQSSSSSSTTNKINNAHTPLDGSVPSWAFARIGNLLSRGGSESDSTRGPLYPSSSRHDEENE
eukprot:CAMPEP_0178955640 /NCGR_PEP_ID=MMETSP0789-20121207/9727_1 /TAXON_ID=3005 /ORGANISM="Rhizosolenia setigera, Strain CCMP 1694" /LENGTH=495 /DNA_ID=CAMNT_0020637313 /DNA_START=100 /DNA_END=1587 /DNA_ORIENTATION=-